MKMCMVYLFEHRHTQLAYQDYQAYSTQLRFSIMPCHLLSLHNTGLHYSNAFISIHTYIFECPKTEPFVSLHHHNKTQNRSHTELYIGSISW